MAEFLPLIRNTSRALITRDKQLLVLVKSDPVKGDRYSLPGGGQAVGESLHGTLQRECIEEINTEVEIAELVQVAEFHKLKTEDLIQHQLEFLFRCSVPANYVPCNGPEPDAHQIDVRWLPFDEVKDATFSPSYLSETVLTHLQHDSNLYLGSYHDNSAS